MEILGVQWNIRKRSTGNRVLNDTSNRVTMKRTVYGTFLLLLRTYILTKSQ